MSSSSFCRSSLSTRTREDGQLHSLLGNISMATMSPSTARLRLIMPCTNTWYTTHRQIWINHHYFVLPLLLWSVSYHFQRKLTLWGRVSLLGEDNILTTSTFSSDPQNSGSGPGSGDGVGRYVVPCDPVLTGGIHNDLNPISALKWM